MLWRTTPLPLKEMKWVVWRKCFGSHICLGHCCELVFVEWFSSEIRPRRNVLLLVFQLSEKKEQVNKFTNELLIRHATLLNRRETNKGLSSVRINKAEPKIALQPVSRLNAAEFTCQQVKFSQKCTGTLSSCNTLCSHQNVWKQTNQRTLAKSDSS